MNRITVLIVVVAITAAVSAALMRGYGSHARTAPNPPVPAAGTIGAANDLRSNQPVGNDAVITDQQMQALRQSDLFHRMQLNPEFRKAMQAGLSRVMSTGDLGPLASLGDALGHVVSDPGFVELAGRTQFTQLLSQGPFQHLAGTLANRPLPVPVAQAGAMGSVPGKSASGKSPSSAPLSRDPEFTKDVDASGLSTSPEFGELMKAPEFQKLIGSSDFQQVARMTEFGRAMTNATMLSLIRLPEFGRILLDADVRKFISTPEVVAASRRPEFERSFLEAGN